MNTIEELIKSIREKPIDYEAQAAYKQKKKEKEQRKEEEQRLQDIEDRKYKYEKMMMKMEEQYEAKKEYKAQRQKQRDDEKARIEMENRTKRDIIRVSLTKDQITEIRMKEIFRDEWNEEMSIIRKIINPRNVLAFTEIERLDIRRRQIEMIEIEQTIFFKQIENDRDEMLKNRRIKKPKEESVKISKLEENKLIDNVESRFHIVENKEISKKIEDKLKELQEENRKREKEEKERKEREEKEKKREKEEEIIRIEQAKNRKRMYEIEQNEILLKQARLELEHEIFLKNIHDRKNMERERRKQEEEKRNEPILKQYELLKNEIELQEEVDKTAEEIIHLKEKKEEKERIKNEEEMIRVKNEILEKSKLEKMRAEREFKELLIEEERKLLLKRKKKENFKRIKRKFKKNLIEKMKKMREN